MNSYIGVIPVCTVCTIVRMEPFFRRTSVHLNCSTAQMLRALYCCRNLNKDIQLNYRGPGLKKNTECALSVGGVSERGEVRPSCVGGGERRG